ncbi:DMT family transporter [Patescibacteria group bacterium]|nr:DMT family transporter [Patescibacteria group bacterium]
MNGQSLFIIGAALLWATDSLLRLPLTQNLTSAAIVFWEHGIAIFIVGPIIFYNWSKLKEIKAREWLAIIFIGLVASALATLAFTASFKYLNPSSSILLIKLQPLVTFLLAAIWLKEKLPKHFWYWAILALVGGYLAAFSFAWPVWPIGSKLAWLGALLAVTAAVSWGCATVVGRYLVNNLDYRLVTALRFLIALPALAILLFWQQGWLGFSLPQSSDLIKLGLILLGPGLGAMFLYYFGLRKTPASLAAVLELLWPVIAVVLNWYFLNQPLLAGQLVGGFILLAAIGRLTVWPYFRIKSI